MRSLITLVEGAFLSELFDTPAVDIADSGSVQYGNFTVAGVPFDFGFQRFTESLHDDWQFSFALNSDHAFDHGVDSIENTGLSGVSAVRVMGIVVGLIRKFLETQQPDSLSFSGANDQRRDVLYGAIAKHLSADLAAHDYQISVKRHAEFTAFRIYRPPIEA